MSNEYNVTILKTEQTNKKRKTKQIFLLSIRLYYVHTCQLTRLDKFSTIKRYSVRNGGPYLDELLEFFDLNCN